MNDNDNTLISHYEADNNVTHNYFYLWEKENINVTCKNIYTYYVNKGFGPLVTKHIMIFMQFLFLVIFTVYMSVCIEWRTVFNDNTTENETFPLKCYSLSAILEQEFGWLLMGFIVIMCMLMGYKLATTPKIIKSMYRTKKIYNELLGVQDKELPTITFAEIVERMKRINNDVLKKEKLTDLDIVNIIMAVDNYVIAMINKDILNLSLPFRNRKIMTTIVELGLFGKMGIPGVLTMTIFNDDNTLNQHFVFNNNTDKLINKLKKRFKVVGLILLLVSPLLFIYLIVHFLFRYAEQIKNQPSFLATREWNKLAQYKFRDFNELPHLFQKRLNKSYKPATEYVSYFDSPIKTIVSEFIIFSLGTVFVTFVLIMLIQSLMLGNIIINSSMLLIVTVLGTMIGLLRSGMPHEYKVYNYNDTMEQIVKNIHYIPMTWIKEAHHVKVKNEFTQLFSYKIINWILELTSVLYVPFVFMFSLANSSGEIVQFVKDFTVYHRKVGHICKFAVFNLKDNGNDTYGSQFTVPNEYNKSKYGKLEMSLINFKETYPDWEHDDEHEEFIRRNASTREGEKKVTFDDNEPKQGVSTYMGGSDTFSEMLESIKNKTQHLEQQECDEEFDEKEGHDASLNV